MSAEKSKSKQQIFADMHRQLRRWNPSIPESVDRLDPILKILLELYSDQLVRIDKRIDQTWQIAVNSLIRSLAPESRRWPIPAYTIMKCEPVDPVVEVDPHARFYFKEKREGGQTFFFSAQKTEKLVKAEVRFVAAKFENTILNLSPAEGSSHSESDVADTAIRGRGPGQVFVGIEYGGMPTGLRDVTLYMQGSETVLRQLRWGHWSPGTNAGGFYEDSSFCPGLTTDLEQLFSVGGEPVNWGGLRTSSDLFKSLENSFVRLPEMFTSTWESGPPDQKLLDAVDDDELRYRMEQDNLHWIRVDLPAGGDKTRFKQGFDLFFNCFVATNKNELSTYKYTGGNRLVEVEIPESLETVLEITQVIDSNRLEYQPVFKIQKEASERTYSLEERSGKLVLWFDYTGHLDVPPDYITVFYSVTAGVAANGIAASDINELYEKHPGVDAAENVTITRGAVPAKTEQQVVAEVAARLRNRDRVLNFQEIVSWAKTFDPRIQEAQCENSVQRAPRGIRRCILVKVNVSAEEFYSDDETSLLRQRLKEFLKSRSPVNTAFQVEVVKR